MIKKFTCANGVVYGKSTETEATVDEVIAFLEQFRGLDFWNGAAGEVAFCVSEGVVSCDVFDFFLNEISERDENLCDRVCDFFYDSDAEEAEE